VRHGSVTSTRRRLGGTALGLGGVAFAVIQILEQTIGAFDPRPIVAGLIAVTIGFAGLALERGRHVAASSRVLRDLLRVWPLRRVGDTDPLVLGVFPPADAARGGALGPYVARDADPAVREALLAGGLVVVVGPGRAGKSRTAAEVARAGLGDRFVVLPVSGAALAALLGDPSFTPPSDAVWWLDDLERFSGELDAAELDALLDGRRVLATVRPQAWEDLLHASGDDGERGRRLAAAARVITVPAAASAAEAERARELHPDLDVGVAGVLGEALAAQPAPAAGDPPAPAPAPGRRELEPRRDRALLLGGGATAASAAVLGLVIGVGGWAFEPPPPISAQVNAIRQAAQRAGDIVLLAREVALHGTDERSHLFVLTPRETGSGELRIYDERGGLLRLGLGFRPKTRGGGGSFAIAPPEELRRGDWDYSLGPPVETDLDGDGRSELVATYGLTTGDGPIAVPVVVGWDDESQRYAISPLLPANQPARAGIPPGAAIDPYFTGAYVLADARTGTRLRAGAALAYRVVEGGRVVVARTVGGGGAPRIAVTVYALSLSRGRSTATLTCTGNAEDTVRVIRLGHRSADAVLAQDATRFAAAAVGGAPPDGSTCVI